MVGCGKNKRPATGTEKEPPAVMFSLPEIPEILTEEADRFIYLALHFWDNYHFQDTAYLTQKEMTERAFADYMELLRFIPENNAVASVNIMLARAESGNGTVSYFSGLFDKYLNDPNSPVRNEKLYIPVLEYILVSPSVSETEKIRSEYQLERALKNRPGTKAANITITLADGRKSTLYDIKSRYILLYFNNPDCSACKEVKAGISDSSLLSRLIDDGTITVFAVYPDEDIKAWRDHLPEMPPKWVSGYDSGLEIRKKETYNLPAIPSIYLLDADHTVIVKDALSIGMLEEYL